MLSLAMLSKRKDESRQRKNSGTDTTQSSIRARDGFSNDDAVPAAIGFCGAGRCEQVGGANTRGNRTVGRIEIGAGGGVVAQPERVKETSLEVPFLNAPL
jgi:hypothetical protein